MVASTDAVLEEIQWFAGNTHMLSLTLKFSNGEVLEHNPCGEDCEMGSIAGLSDLTFTNACYKTDHLDRMLGDSFYLDSDEGGRITVGSEGGSCSNNVELPDLPIKGMMVSARADNWSIDYFKFLYLDDGDVMYDGDVA